MIKSRSFFQTPLLILVLLGITVSPILSVFQTTPALAANNDYLKMSPQARMKLQDGLKILEFCENSGGKLSISAGHGDSVDDTWNIIGGGADIDATANGGGVAPGVTSITLPAYYSSTTVNCNQVIRNYAGVFGITDAKTFLDDAGFANWSAGKRIFSGGCGNRRASEISCLKSAVITRVANYSSVWDSQMYYVRNKAILDAKVGGSSPGGCFTHWTSQTSPGQLDLSQWAGQFGRSGDDGILGDIANPTIVKLVNDVQTPTDLKDYYVMSEGGDGDDGWNKIVNTDITTDGNKITNGGPARCESLATAFTSSKSSLYIEWLKTFKEAHPGAETPPVLSTGGLNVGPATPKPTCVIDGIGWIVCPVVNFMAKIADGAFGFLADSFLRTDPNMFNTASPTYTAWSVMRNIANVAFVVIFLIIIFSQLTSVGITNYGVKKLLPRIVIAAILVNASYFICQIAVDLSNILGYSIRGILENIGSATNAPTAGANFGGTNPSPFADGSGFAGVAGAVLGFSAVITVAYLLLSALVPVLLAAVVALIMILFILIARQALIILLVVISPLAFVAFLMPNTEQWFKKWQKTFTAMLMLFPIVAFVFGMSSLASTILSNTVDGGFAESEANVMFTQIIAAAVLILPLFVVPGLLKKSLDSLGGIGAKINGIGGKLGGTLGTKGKQSYDQSALGRGRALKKQGKQEFRNRKFNDAMAGGDGATARVRRALGQGGRPFSDSSKFARNRGTQLAKGASAAADNKDYNDAVAAATAEQRTETVAQVAMMAATGKNAKGDTLTEHQRAAAIDRTMSSGGFNERKAVLESLASDKAHTTRELRNRAINGSYAKGDQNIYGVGFGDQILAESGVDPITGKIVGGINGKGDLAAATAKNAADGNVQAEHLVQGSSATEYLVKSALDSGDPYAQNNLRNAAATLRTTPPLQGKSNPQIDSTLGTL